MKALLWLAILIVFATGNANGQCLPTPNTLSCGATSTFSLSASGYTGSMPTSGASGCNPCCYAGSDLDCDGSQDVPFSVENSVWFQYCNTTGATQVLTVNVDEPGSGGTCNIQGAVWTGAVLNATTLSCGNANYNFFDSNAGGSADGFSFSNVSVPNGQCVFVMVDGYGGSTCSNIGITVVCPCVPPVITVTPSGASICSGQSAALTASGAATYTWTPSTGLSAITGATVTASPTVSTVYTVIGTTADGCTASKTVTVIVKAKPTVAMAVTNASCGLSNGSITATGGGATSPYTYLWSNGATTQTATGLAPGAYTVTVTSANGCTNAATTVVGNAASMTLNITTGPSTCSTSNGTASVAVSGATGPFTYLWSTGATTQSVSSLASGTFYVTVTAANGCTESGIAEINGSSGPLFNINHVAATCNKPNGSVNITPSNGNGNQLTFLWSNGATTKDLSNVAPGTYTVTITNAGGCTSEGTVTIASTPPVVLGTPTVQNATCNTSNGSATAVVQSGTGPFTYLWSTGATTASISNLAAGGYGYTVTSANGCAASGIANVSNTAAPVVNTSSVNSTCESSNGSASVSVMSGGVPPFTYLWSTGATTTSVSGLAAGTYNVSVQDAVGCVTTKAVTVVNSPSPVLSITPVSSTCGLGNGSAGVSVVSGGTAPLTYLWSNGSTLSSANNLSSGTHSVTVTNGLGCTATQSISITNIPGATFTLQPENATCGLNNGNVGPDITDGVAPFTYAWSTGATTQNLVNTGAGNYTLTITDGNGCTTTQSATITTTTVPNITFTTTNATCGYPNGTATALPANGTAPYSFVWNNGATSATANGLASGTYSVTVIDGVGCTKANTVSVVNKPAPTLSQTHVNATCGNANGSINLSVNAVAGTSPFTYVWTNGATTQDLTNVPGGNYTVTVTDANGCTAALLVTLPNVPAPQLLLIPNTSTCGNPNGTVNAQITGGTSPLSYIWNTGSTTQDLINVAAGSYTLLVTDANGCTTTQTTTVINTAGPQISVIPTATTCGLANGSATVNITGGTSPFVYAWSNGATTAALNGLVAATYTVTVTDANGCTAVASGTVAASTSPVVSLTPVSTTCGLSNGSIGVGVTAGVPPYTFVWTTGATSQNLNNITAGSYSVTVTDAVGCTSSATTSVSNIAGPTLIATHTNATCGISNGTATASPSGGTLPYTFLWSNGATTATAGGLGAGVFQVTVTDANGCTVSQSTTVTAATAPIVSINAINSTCGLSNGSANALVTNGTPPYSYLWSTGATVAGIGSLAAGSFAVTVTDAAGCTVSTSATITTSQLPVVAITPTNPTCGLSNGSLVASVTQGNAPYTYLWSTGSTSSFTGNLAAGTYTLTVTTQDGCTASKTATITSTVVPTVSASSTPTSCGLNNGTVSATAGTGSAPYAYLWNNGSSSSSLSGLAPGSYSVTVTSADGCTVSSTVSVGTSTSPVILLSPSPSSCSSANGSVAATISQGTTPYAYQWSNGATTQSLSNVVAGSYTLTVTDAAGCTAIQTTTVTNNAAPTATSTVVNATCNNANGSVTIVVNGGTPSFSFLWSNGSTSQNLPATGAGSYTLTITDANNCSVAVNATVTNAPPPTVPFSAVPSTCGLSNGSISVSPAGTSPFSFLWSTGSTNATLNNLPAGSYTVTVTDANACTTIQTVNIASNPSPVLSITATTNTTCGNSNGAIDISTNGGAAPVQFSWSNGATTEDLSNIPAGSYTLTATDANGCTAVIQSTLADAPPPVLTTVSTNASCGNANGSAGVVISNGSAPFQIVWSNGTTTQNANGLVAATYGVTVTDANGCTAAATASVNNNSGPVISVSNVVSSTCGNSNGAVTVAVSGGAAPLSFSWSNGASTQNISNIPEGSYALTVTDANGCQASLSASVANIPGPALTVTPVNATCGLANGSVSANLTGGTSPFVYSWSNGSTAQTITSLGAGAYSVTVTDNNGCTSMQSVTLSAATAPVVSLDGTDETCGSSNGSITSTPSAGTPPYTFVWSTGSATQGINGLVAGTYTVTITDDAGCTVSQTATISNQPPPTFTLTSANATCGLPNGTAAISGLTGGASPFDFIWSNGSSLSSITGVLAGAYGVTVTDANNCTTAQTIIVANAASPVVNATPVNTTCNLSNGSVSLDVNDGTLPYTFLWSDNSTTQTLSGISQGSYSVTVTDANGCQAFATVSVSDAPPPSIDLTTIPSACGYANGTLNVGITNGTAPYTFLWSTGITTQNLNSVVAGTYSVTITDANNCTATGSATVQDIPGPLAQLIPVNATCGLSNGSVSQLITNGTQPFAYLWNNGATTQNLDAAEAGSYSVTVTDANSCTVTATALLSTTPLPEPEIVTTNTSCGFDNGDATVNVNSGTPPISFSWSNGSTQQSIDNISAGNYNVTVTDDVGCTAVATVNISPSTSPIITLSPVPSTCSESNGVINGLVADGISPYTFVWSNGATTASLTNAAAGTYGVTVTDAEGCTTSAIATIQDMPPPVLSVTAQDATCSQPNGSVASSVTGGTQPFTFVWSNGASTQDLSGITDGTYSLTVTDANGCIDSEQVSVINHAEPLLSLSSVSSSCGAANGSVTSSVSGGTVPLTYVWSNGSTTTDIPNVPAGTYSLTVSDAYGCTAIESATVTDNSSPEAEVAATQSTCGLPNGTVTLAVTGGAQPYAFAWSDGATTQDLQGLLAGLYSVTVTDSNGCIVAASAFVNDAPAPVLNATVTDVMCGNANGSVQVSVSSGTAPFDFLWSNGETGQIVADVLSGVFGVTVTDANNCTASFSSTVSEIPQPVLLLTSVNSTCGYANGSIAANVNSGISPYSFFWSDGSSEQSLPDVSEGTYSVTVTDSIGCTVTDIVTINTTALPVISGGTITNANCNQSNGSIGILAENGTAPLSFEWSNGGTTQFIGNIVAGIYSVTVTDAVGCTATESYNISNLSGPYATAEAVASTCGDANGEASLNVSDGVLPYTFAWSNGASTSSLSGVLAGLYTVTVTDAEGCQVITSVSIPDIAGPQVTINGIHSTCGLPNGSSEAIVIGGTAPYGFVWSTGETNATLQDLSEATYSITITDNNGCTATGDILISTTQLPGFTITPTAATCGEPNGTATVISGVSPLVYNWSDGSTDQTASGLSPAIYSVTVTDTVGCSASNDVVIDATPLPSLTESHANATCELPNGAIDLTATGALPFSFAWSNGSTTEDLSGIVFGTYTVTASDANGCSASLSVSLSDTEPPSLSTSVINSACGLSTGSVGVVISVDTEPYQFLWSNGQTSMGLSNVPAGTYSLTVTDVNGCTVSATATVNDESAPQLTTGTLTNTTCSFANGSATINVTGGALPYTFNWSNGATTQNITDVFAGSYTITVTDANGCQASQSIVLTDSPSPDATVIVTNETCGDANGSIDLTVIGDASPFEFIWSNGMTTEDIASLAAGTYTVTITDANNCTTAFTQNISGTEDLSVDFTSVNTSCSLANGSLSATVSGGTSPFTYLWSIGSTTQNIQTLNTGSYTLTVTDANGCTTTETSTIDSSTNPLITSVIADATCGNGNGEIDISVTDGIEPFSFLWSNGVTDEDLIAVPAGNYNVTVSDAAGCSAAASLSVNNPGAPAVSITANNTSCQANNGSINLDISGGVLPYQFLWNNGATTEDLNDLQAGSYSVTINDASGCISVAAAQVSSPSVPVVITDIVGETCGGQNGGIDVNISSGTEPFAFLWSNGATTQDISGVGSGVYELTLTDAAGCTVTTNAIVTGSGVPQLSPISTHTTCNEPNGSVDLTVTGGADPINIFWSNGETTEDIASLPAGTYTVTVSDANGCSAETTVAVNSSDAVVYTLSSQPAACGLNNGSVVLSVTNGTQPLLFMWSNGTTLQNLANAPAGSYSVTVTDASGCTATLSTSLSNANGPTLTFTQIQPTCNAPNGSIDITISGGLQPFNTLWSNASTNEDLTNLTSGNYTVTVTDANNCQAVQTIVLAGVAGPSLQSTFTAATCGNANASVNLAVTGGIGPFVYSWSNGSTTEDLAGITSGTYSVTVTDANGCSATHARNVTGTPAPVISLSVANATCGFNNGAIASNVSGGLSPFVYAWSNGAITSNITSLAPNTYSVTVNTANGCFATASATIQPAPAPTLTASAVNASCGLPNGSVSITVTNAASAGTFMWSNGATTQNLTNASPGNYSVTASFGVGCSATAQASITGTLQPALSLTGTNASCNQNDGTINAVIGNGTGPYNFLWSNNATSQNLTGLQGGEYTVTVTDAVGCTVADSIFVDAEVCSFTLQLQPFGATCGLQNGLVDVTVSGGTQPFAFSWSNGATTQNINNLDAGNYGVTVTDANGTTATGNAVVVTTESPEISLSSTAASCGTPNGSVDVTVSNGLSPYSFIWSNGATTQSLINITAGVYSVTVSDANGCTASDTANVQNLNGPQVTLIVNDAVCTQANGLVAATVNGGTEPYSYLWSNGDSNANLMNVATGTYSLTVTDSTGCQAFGSATVNSTGSLSVSLFAISSTCGDANGSVSVENISGTSPFIFIWSNGASTQSIENIFAGTYILTVTDSNGCSGTAVANVDGTLAPSLSVEPANETCGSSNGSADLTIGNGTAPFTVIWSNGSTLQNLSAVTAGTYNVTVTDNAGCSATTTTSIANSNGPTLSETHTDATCQQPDGSIDLSVSGGSQAYTFLWNNGFTTEDINGLVAGAYSVTVTDGNGCTSEITIDIVTSQPPVVTLDVVDASCGLQNGQISADVSSGTPLYAFIWSSGQTTQSLTNIGTGSYSITVTDNSGCSASASANVGNTNGPVIASTVTNETCSNQNAGIDLSVGGGVAPVLFLWSTGFTGEDLSGIGSGNYVVTVTDANNCSATQSFNITNALSPSLNASSSNANCGVANGSVVLSVSNGATPFVFNWSNSATTQNLTNVTANVYTVTVTDANACTAILSATVAANGAPVVSLSSLPSGCTVANGSVALTISGGAQPYNYNWNTGATTQSLSNISAGTYTVTVTDANNCPVVASIVVGTTASPSLVLSPVNSTCGNANGAVNVNATGGTSPYSFLWSNGATTENLIGISQGLYVLTLTDANGCSASSGVSVNNANGPTVTFIGSAPEACHQDNGTALVDVTGGATPYSYAWSNGSTEQDLINVGSGDYELTVTDQNNCTALTEATVGFVNGPSAYADPIPETCDGYNGSVDLTVTAGTPPFVFVWSNEATTEDIAHLVGGYYNVTVTDNNACTLSVGSAVLTIPHNAVSLSVLPDTVCAGTTLNVSAGGVTTYQWSPASGLGTTTGNSNTVTVLTNQSYTVIGTDANGCTSKATFDVSAAPAAQAIAGTPQAGCPPFNGVLLSGSTEADATQWWVDGEMVSTDEAALITLGTGVYNVALIALTEFGCNDTLHLPGFINVYSKPDAGFTLEQSPLSTAEYAFTNVSLGATSYAWEFGDGNGDSVVHPVHIYEEPSDYTVTLIATNEYGCHDTALRAVSPEIPYTIFIPNTFTPNGDGINDFFTVYGKGFRKFHLWIYDRWGEKVFDTDDGITTWDGIFQGKPLNTAVFVYIADIELLDGTSEKRVGDITLLR